VLMAHGFAESGLPRRHANEPARRQLAAVRNALTKSRTLSVPSKKASAAIWVRRRWHICAKSGCAEHTGRCWSQTHRRSRWPPLHTVGASPIRAGSPPHMQTGTVRRPRRPCAEGRIRAGRNLAGAARNSASRRGSPRNTFVAMGSAHLASSKAYHA
jgi:hypothetical protein